MHPTGCRTFNNSGQLFKGNLSQNQANKYNYYRICRQICDAGDSEESLSYVIINSYFRNYKTLTLRWSFVLYKHIL
jgi:hypothetical protein